MEGSVLSGVLRSTGDKKESMSEIGRKIMKTIAINERKSVGWKKNLWKAILVNLCFVIFFTLFFDLKFEVADDYIMSTILYGGYGYCSPYDVFQNLLLTKGIVKLILWFPGIAWYTIAQLASLFGAIVIISYLVYEANCKRLRFVVWSVWLFFVWYECYAKMQFTKTAALTSIAGILLVYRFCKGQSRNRWMTLIGAIVFCGLGMMWRASAFGMVFLVLFVIGLEDLISSIKDGKVLKKFLIYILALAIMGVGFVGLKWYQDKNYAQNPEWSKYFVFNSARAQLVDYSWPDYSENRELYESLGIDEQDIDLFDRWNYGDPEIFSTETVLKLSQVREKDSQTITQAVKQFLPQIISHLIQAEMLVTWVLLLLVSLCLKPKKSGIFITYGILVAIGMEFYFLYIGREMLNRLDVGIIAGNGIVLALQQWDENREKKMFSLLTLASLCLGYLKFPVTEEIKDCGEKQKLQEDVAYMNSDQGAIYYGEEFTIDKYESATAGIWDCPRVGLYSNISRLGGWKYPSPEALAVGNRYGISNPYQQMVDNPNVYLVSKSKKLADKIEAYIQRHYNEDAYIVKRKELNGSNVYQVVTKNDKINIKLAKESDDVIGSLYSVQKGSQGGIKITGEVYKQGSNSYTEKINIKITDLRTGKFSMHNVSQMVADESRTLEEGRYGSFEKTITKYEMEDVPYLKMEAYVTIDGEIYHKNLSVK